MPKEAIATENAPSPVGPYSQGIVANGLLYTAGFGPQDPATGEMAEDIVKSTVHLQHLDRDFAGFNIAYREFFSDPFPVRTTVGSTLAGILVEIDVVVALKQ